jgi:hypothetical protein
VLEGTGVGVDRLLVLSQPGQGPAEMVVLERDPADHAKRAMQISGSLIRVSRLREPVAGQFEVASELEDGRAEVPVPRLL